MSAINIYYIRAAIEANTGRRLTLSQTRDLLVEEGLLTRKQAKRHCSSMSYSQYHDEYLPAVAAPERTPDLIEELSDAPSPD